MNLTIEVEIDHGRVIPRGSDVLPEKAFGTLTLRPEPTESVTLSSVDEFLDEWAGAFSLPASPEDDARLAYLLAKHVK